MNKISRKVTRYFTAFLLCVSFLFAHGSDSLNISIPILRPVTSAYTLSIGSESILDTYLSPIRYNGWSIRLGYERIQAVNFNPERWSMQMAFGINYASVDNMVKNRTMRALMGDFNWGMLYRWRPLPKLIVSAGAGIGFEGGVIYNASNSNNPVSVKIHPYLNITGMAIYNMNIGKLPITLRYQPSLPFFGVFFSPDYGEAFYEIYVGNRKNLVHVGWWGNRFDMVNLLTADLHFGNTSLRLGYRGTIQSSWINNLNTQIFTNCAVIGLSGEWTNLNPRKTISEKAKVISAMY